MSSRWKLCGGVLALALGHTTAFGQAAAGSDVVVYHVRGGDTLIGLAHRLLTPTSLWRELGRLNHIEQERRLVPGSEMRIPIPWLRWTDRPVEVLAVSGNVSANGRTVVAGDRLHEGESITSGAGGSLAIRLPDGSEVHVPPKTTLLLQRVRAAEGIDAPDIRLGLPTGDLEVAAKKHRDTGRFEISTPTAITAVRGTEYRTHYSDTNAAATSETLSGTIEVRASGTALPVAAGYGTLAKGDAPPLPPVPLLPAPALDGIPAVNHSPSLELQFPQVNGAVQYRVQISRSQNFEALEQDTSAKSPPIQIEALESGEHWLKVRAVDANGIEGFDAVRNYSQHTLPDAPRVRPEVNVSGDGLTQHFSWQGSSERYRFELASSGTPEAPILQTETTATSFEAARLPLGTYKWRVAAINAQGELGFWSESADYIQRPLPPSVTAVESPRKKPVVVHWNPQPGYTAVVQVSSQENFQGNLIELRSDGSSVQLPKLAVGRHFIRLRFVAADGYTGPFGATQSAYVRVPVWVWVVIGAAALLPAAL